MVLLRVMSGGEEAVALAGLEAASAGEMLEGTVGWMVLAAAAASESLWELDSDAGFMWMGRGLIGLRGLLGLRPVTSLKGSKAVEMYGGYMMQIMNSDDNIILNMIAKIIKNCQRQESSTQASEADLEECICGCILYSALSLLNVANISTAAIDLRLRRTAA